MSYYILALEIFELIWIVYTLSVQLHDIHYIDYSHQSKANQITCTTVDQSIDQLLKQTKYQIYLIYKSGAWASFIKKTVINTNKFTMFDKMDLILI